MKQQWDPTIRFLTRGETGKKSLLVEDESRDIKWMKSVDLTQTRLIGMKSWRTGIDMVKG